MPEYIPNDEPQFMCWVPGSSTEKQERAERIAQAVAETCSVDEIDERNNRPFYFCE